MNAELWQRIQPVAKHFSPGPFITDTTMAASVSAIMTKHWPAFYLGVLVRRRCFCYERVCVSRRRVFPWLQKPRAVHCEWRDKCFSPSGPFIKPGLPFWLMKSGSRRAHRVLLSHRRGQTGERERSHRPGCPLRPPPCLFSDNKRDSPAPHQLEVKKQLGHTLAFIFSCSFQTQFWVFLSSLITGGKKGHFLKFFVTWVTEREEEDLAPE